MASSRKEGEKADGKHTGLKTLSRNSTFPFWRKSPSWLWTTNSLTLFSLSSTGITGTHHHAWLEPHLTLPLILPLVNISTQISLCLGWEVQFFVCLSRQGQSSLCSSGFLEFTMSTRFVLNAQNSTRLCLLGAMIKGLHPHPLSRWECSILGGFVLALIRICRKGQIGLMGSDVQSIPLSLPGCSRGCTGSWGRRNSKIFVSLQHCSCMEVYFIEKILLPKLTLRALSLYCPILSSWARNLVADSCRVHCLVFWF